MRVPGGEAADAVAARRLLALQYGARLPAGHTGFRWPPTAILLAVQDVLWADMNAIDEGVGGEGDAVYQQSYLKQLLRRLEDGVAHAGATGTLDDEGEELVVNEDLIEAYASLMASTPSTSVMQPGARTVTYFLPSLSASVGTSLFPGWRMLRIFEEGTTIARGTTGLKTWEACLRLAGHLVLYCDALLSSSTIIELGCGTGMLGVLTACVLGGDADRHSRRVILTDLDGPVLEKAQQTVDRNVDTNATAANVSVAPLDWLDVQRDEEHACRWLDSQRAGLVMAADVVFDPDLVMPLCCVLKRALNRVDGDEQVKPKVVAPFALLASTVRNPDTFALLVETLHKSGLSMEESELLTPVVDLRTLDISSSSLLQEQSGGEEQPLHLLRLLPSLHDDRRDGEVKLLRISIKPKTPN